MTHSEPRVFRLNVGDPVKMFDTHERYPNGEWIYGMVEEMGPETFTVKWEDLNEPTEYEKSDCEEVEFHVDPQKTALTQAIEACRELGEKSNYASICIEIMNKFLPIEKQQIEQAGYATARQVLGMSTPDLNTLASDYFTNTYTTTK